MTTANALLKFNSNRARRMSETEARETLARLGFGNERRLRHSVARDGRADYERHSTREDGSPRYDRARLTVTFSI